MYSYISGVDATQNTNISNLTTWLNANNLYSAGVDATQNTNISNLQTWLNANNLYSAGVDATQNTNIQSAWNKANGAVQTAFVGHTANGTSITPSSNNDTLTITSATANGINVIGNATTKTIDFGLRNSGVTSGVYGGSTNIPVLNIDQFGKNYFCIKYNSINNNWSNR